MVKTAPAAGASDSARGGGRRTGSRSFSSSTPAPVLADRGGENLVVELGELLGEAVGVVEMYARGRRAGIGHRADAYRVRRQPLADLGGDAAGVGVAPVDLVDEEHRGYAQPPERAEE